MTQKDERWVRSWGRSDLKKFGSPNLEVFLIDSTLFTLVTTCRKFLGLPWQLVGNFWDSRDNLGSSELLHGLCSWQIKIMLAMRAIQLLVRNIRGFQCWNVACWDLAGHQYFQSDLLRQWRWIEPNRWIEPKWVEMNRTKRVFGVDPNFELVFFCRFWFYSSTKYRFWFYSSVSG